MDFNNFEPDLVDKICNYKIDNLTKEQIHEDECNTLIGYLKIFSLYDKNISQTREIIKLDNIDHLDVPTGEPKSALITREIYYSGLLLLREKETRLFYQDVKDKIVWDSKLSDKIFDILIKQDCGLFGALLGANNLSRNILHEIKPLIDIIESKMSEDKEYIDYIKIGDYYSAVYKMVSGDQIYRKISHYDIHLDEEDEQSNDRETSVHPSLYGSTDDYDPETRQVR